MNPVPVAITIQWPDASAFGDVVLWVAATMIAAASAAAILRTLRRLSQGRGTSDASPEESIRVSASVGPSTGRAEPERRRKAA